MGVLAAVETRSDLDIVGEARDLESGRLHYTEYHRCEQGGVYCQVVYRDPAGAVIAVKDVDYSQSLHAPELLLRDVRRGETQRVDSKHETDWVVDAGFDHFVRSRWERLVAGKSVRFPFLVAGREKPVRLLAERREKGACDGDELCLRVTLDSWFLAMLVPPIDLVYDRREQRLLQFRGTSNIRGADGGSLQVQIDYRYPAAAVADSDMSR